MLEKWAREWQLPQKQLESPSNVNREWSQRLTCANTIKCKWISCFIWDSWKVFLWEVWGTWYTKGDRKSIRNSIESWTKWLRVFWIRGLEKITLTQTWIVDELHDYWVEIRFPLVRSERLEIYLWYIESSTGLSI